MGHQHPLYPRRYDLHAGLYDKHRARRQPLNAFFSKARVASRLDLVQRKVDRLCERIAEFAGTGRALGMGVAISAF
ncbi:hypothetical protein DL765_000751 [Monosporascus sp. GIB2]|nr:hypothetical protein DL765_000751 [Monosporascus sp. GIB2]